MSLVNLDEDHLNAIQNTIQHILSTQRAEYTLAQVVDGVPTKDASVYKFHAWLPEIVNRIEPSSEALELVKKWRSDFRLTSLEIDSDVLETFRQSTFGTRQYNLRLIEITAVVIHAIAALLFERTNKPPYKRPPAKRRVIFVDGLPKETDELLPSPFPTFLFHDNYLDLDLYPMGVADIVAYWVETQLFGGVVVFDHGASETEFLDVYLHPDSRFKVFKLSDPQIDQFIAFGLYGETKAPSPFPIKAEREAIRLFQEFTMQNHIFRSKNDRRVPEIDMASWHPRGRLEDDPQMMEIIEKYHKGELKYGYNEV